MEAVALRSVTMSFRVASDFMSYKGGVYTKADCSQNQGGHAVSIVGYKDNYWIVRNSWGGAWGESGYFRIEKRLSGTGVCEMYSRASYANW